jgi:hypothetical protein
VNETDLQRPVLDQRAHAFIIDALTHGHRLSRMLASELPIKERGEVQTWLPSTVSDPYRLDHSIASPGFSRLADESLAIVLSEEVERGATCVFEHRYARPNDPVMSGRQDHVAIDDEVYFVASRGAGAEGVRRAMRGSRTTPMHIGFLSKSPLESLEAYARKVYAVCVSAYDGDSYLLWQSGDAVR